MSEKLEEEPSKQKTTHLHHDLVPRFQAVKGPPLPPRHAAAGHPVDEDQARPLFEEEPLMLSWKQVVVRAGSRVGTSRQASRLHRCVFAATRRRAFITGPLGSSFLGLASAFPYCCRQW